MVFDWLIRGAVSPGVAGSLFGSSLFTNRAKSITTMFLGGGATVFVGSGKFIDLLMGMLR